MVLGCSEVVFICLSTWKFVLLTISLDNADLRRESLQNTGSYCSYQNVLQHPRLLLERSLLHETAAAGGRLCDGSQ